MSDLIVTQLGRLDAPGQGYPVKSKSSGAHTLTATITGVGAVGFTGALMGSNDNVSWVIAATLSASGTNVAVAAPLVSGDYAFWRLDAATMTGVSALVSGVLATDSSSSVSATRARIAVGILGQSNELGQVANADEVVYPQAFGSLRIPGVAAPLAGSVTLDSSRLRKGGMWFKFIDDLFDHGYRVDMFNGSVGSMSMLTHAAGTVRNRANTTAYSMRRSPEGLDDLGHGGDILGVQGKQFVCTKGRKSYATNRTQYRTGLGTSAGKIDSITTVNTGELSAASEPAGYATAVVGDVVVDGTCEFTCISVSAWTADAPFSETQSGAGWDPFGILERLHQSMQLIQGVESRHIILCNGQSDTAVTQLNYQTALINVARYFLRRGYQVHIGLSCYTPTTATANYDKLAAGVVQAITSTQGDAGWGSRARAGANLYALMGSTGVMGAGGAYLQGDNLHLSGPGAIVAGGHWADSFKAILPLNA